MKDGKRLFWVDILRGFLILSVILGHALQRGDYSNSIVWNIIYSFHMATFFVLSGWISYKSDLIGTKGLINRAKSLVGPLVIWSIIKILIQNRPSEYLSQVWQFILHPDKTYWFLYVLFATVAILEFCKYLCLRFKLRQTYVIISGVIILFCAMIAFDIRIFGFQFIAYYFFFYSLGFIIRKFNLTLKLGTTILFGIIWLILAIFWRMHKVPEPMNIFVGFIPSSVLIYSYRIITASLGSIFFLNLSRILFENRDVKLVGFLGTISLELYIVHSAIGDYLKKAMLLIPLEEETMAYNLSSFLLLTTISVIIIVIISNIPILKKLLFCR